MVYFFRVALTKSRQRHARSKYKMSKLIDPNWSLEEKFKSQGWHSPRSRQYIFQVARCLVVTQMRAFFAVCHKSTSVQHAKRFNSCVPEEAGRFSASEFSKSASRWQSVWNRSLESFSSRHSSCASFCFCRRLSKCEAWPSFGFVGFPNDIH